SPGRWAGLPSEDYLGDTSGTGTEQRLRHLPDAEALGEHVVVNENPLAADALGLGYQERRSKGPLRLQLSPSPRQLLEGLCAFGLHNRAWPAQVEGVAGAGFDSGRVDDLCGVVPRPASLPDIRWA